MGFHQLSASVVSSNSFQWTKFLKNSDKFYKHFYDRNFRRGSVSRRIWGPTVEIEYNDMYGLAYCAKHPATHVKFFIKCVEFSYKNIYNCNEWKKLEMV